MFSFLMISDEETEAIITDELAKFTKKVARPGREPVCDPGPHFAVPCSLSHF